MGSWLTEFHSFTWQHALVAGGLAAVMGAVITCGRAWRGTPRERTLRHVLVGIIAVTVIAGDAYYLSPGQYDPAMSLPLQLCDLALVMAALALGPGWRWARALLYFWGLLLSSQGFFTPTLTHGFGHPRFWFFWSMHAMIVGGALYDLIVLRFRPTGRDLLFAMTAILVYTGLMIWINVRMGWNYGFVGPSSPGTPTIVDALGPWPLRLVWMAAMVFAVQAAAWAVWKLGRSKPARGE